MSDFIQGHFYQTYFDAYPSFSIEIYNKSYLEYIYNYYYKSFCEHYKTLTDSNIIKKESVETLNYYTYDILDYISYPYYNTYPYEILDEITYEESNTGYININIKHTLYIENCGYFLFILLVLGVYLYLLFSIIGINKKKIKGKNVKPVAINTTDVIKQPEV